MLLRILMISFALLAVSTYTTAEEPVSGFNWDNWAQALNDSPCNWFSAEQWQQLLETDYQAQASNSKDATRCKFTNSAQAPLLTISIRSMANAAAVNAERDGMLAQINQYGSDHFEQLPTTQQAVTAILRKDKLQLFIFANSDNETAFILLSGHPIRTDSAGQKTLRKTRLTNTAEQIFSHFGF